MLPLEVADGLDGHTPAPRARKNIYHTPIRAGNALKGF